MPVGTTASTQAGNSVVRVAHPVVHARAIRCTAWEGRIVEGSQVGARYIVCGKRTVIEVAVLLSLDPAKRDQNQQKGPPTKEGVRNSHLLGAERNNEGEESTITNAPMVGSLITMLNRLLTLCGILRHL
jgi:hypothetical protein